MALKNEASVTNAVLDRSRDHLRIKVQIPKNYSHPNHAITEWPRKQGRVMEISLWKCDVIEFLTFKYSDAKSHLRILNHSTCPTFGCLWSPIIQAHVRRQALKIFWIIHQSPVALKDAQFMQCTKIKIAPTRRNSSLRTPAGVGLRKGGYLIETLCLWLPLSLSHFRVIHPLLLQPSPPLIFIRRPATAPNLPRIPRGPCSVAQLNFSDR